MANNHYFSVADGRLCYFGIPLEETGLLQESRDVLDKLTLPGRLIRERGFSEDTERVCWISLAFCIANQAINFERPVKFSRELCKYGLEYVSEDAFVHDKALEHNLLWPENRYKPAFDFLKSLHGGIAQFASDYLLNPSAYRRELIHPKWISSKTASFWYLCLGGNQLLTLDRHLFRQLAGLGVPISNPHFYIPKLRKNGRSKGKSVIVKPSLEEYEQIEHDALLFLSRFPSFTGEHIGDMATSLFWTAGAEGKRKGAFCQWNKRTNSEQMQLFTEPPQKGSLKFDTPFVLESPLKRHWGHR